VISDRYELEDILGRGGMAEVRRAVDTRIGRPVAVKQLRADLATDPTFQARFRREAQSAVGLNHPNIVAVYDTGEEIDPQTGVSIPYIVMELVEGPTLRDVLRDGRKILPERALELTQGVLDALDYSHKAGIIHRDIEPASVMVTQTGGVKVMDFGIAGSVVRTAQYLSPEQARGETVDARSDIYSAGCLLYELLVGRPPFVGESPVNVAYQHVREMPVPPSQLDSVITPEIDAVTLKALAKDPADRYQSAREMKADITRVLSGQRPTDDLLVAREPTSRPSSIPRLGVEAPGMPAPAPPPMSRRLAGRHGRRQQDGFSRRARREAARERRASARLPAGAPQPKMGTVRPRELLADIDRAIAEVVVNGRLAFNPPDRMRQGHAERMEVTIARSTTMDNKLREGLRGPGAVRMADVETSPFMSVELQGENFQVTPLTAREQLLRPTARWEYDVLPRRPGNQKLQLSVMMRIPLPERPDEKVSVPVLEYGVRVSVDPVYGVRRFVSKNWQWLVATVAGLAGVLTAWLKLFRGGE
jgi:tRNA A-37 threonylcarbamoyl transferase component Bud32